MYFKTLIRHYYKLVYLYFFNVLRNTQKTKNCLFKYTQTFILLILYYLQTYTFKQSNGTFYTTKCTYFSQ